MDPHRRVEQLSSLLDVARALAEQPDLDSVLHRVVDHATRMVGAERSTLFLYDPETDELWSKVAQGVEDLRFAASTGLAGAVVRENAPLIVEDAYADPRFNREVDVQTGFRTRSILAVPMRSTRGEVVGVLQALNRTSGEAFDEEDRELLMALGGVAGAAICNAMLLEEIEQLFEGFAKASVVAIEARDPSTAGHSGRVADLTTSLAELVDLASSGPFEAVRFSRDQLQELRYAALLHDFGKVGVRENVLVKAKKLHPGEEGVVLARFEAIRLSLQARSAERRLSISLTREPGWETALAEEVYALDRAIAEVEEALAIVQASNLPTVREQEVLERLAGLAEQTWRDARGELRPWLTAEEVRLLSIRRGSLSPAERAEIESHVTHTYNFLSQIPWTRALRRVPEIAYGHHERLDGTGYPRGLTADEIPLQAKVISVADIYDALTAMDRPYKKAVPHELALDILHEDARLGRIDGDLLRIFIEADVPRRSGLITSRRATTG